MIFKLIFFQYNRKNFLKEIIIIIILIIEVFLIYKINLKLINLII